jgi:hypothetical protein
MVNFHSDEGRISVILKILPSSEGQDATKQIYIFTML